MWIIATTPSTLTPTYENPFPSSTSPQVSRKNSLVSSANRCSPLQEEVHQQQRETVIRFQLENEIIGPKTETPPMNCEAGTSSASGTEDINKTDGSSGTGANKLGQLFFKVR